MSRDLDRRFLALAEASVLPRIDDDGGARRFRPIVPTAADIRVEQRPPGCPARRAEVAAGAVAAMRARAPDTG